MGTEAYRGGGANQKFSNKSVEPGAHPEFDKGTQLGNPIQQIGGLIKAIKSRFNGSGSHTSPSTKRYK